VRYRDADGREFPLGTGGKAGSAPAFVHSLGEKPYSVANVALALRDRDPRRAPMEYAMSEKLAEVGYAPSFGGCMIPLGAGLLWQQPGNEQQVERLAVDIKQAFDGPIGDADDVATARSLMMRRSKAMDNMDDLRGGSLIDLPASGPLIDYLRTKPVVAAAGATQIGLPPQGSLVYPRGLGDPSFTWMTPNTPIPESDPATGALLLTAKRAGGLVRLP